MRNPRHVTAGESVICRHLLHGFWPSKLQACSNLRNFEVLEAWKKKQFYGNEGEGPPTSYVLSWKAFRSRRPMRGSCLGAADDRFTPLPGLCLPDPGASKLLAARMIGRAWMRDSQCAMSLKTAILLQACLLDPDALI